MSTQVSVSVGFGDADIDTDTPFFKGVRANVFLICFFFNFNLILQRATSDIREEFLRDFDSSW